MLPEKRQKPLTIKIEKLELENYLIKLNIEGIVFEFFLSLAFLPDNRVSMPLKSNLNLEDYQDIFQIGRIKKGTPVKLQSNDYMFFLVFFSKIIQTSKQLQKKFSLSEYWKIFFYFNFIPDEIEIFKAVN